MQTRLLALRILSIACFILLAFAFWILQVVQHDKYGPWADKNYLRTIPLRAPRGVLFDRTGNTSAGSVPLALDEAVRSGRVQRGQLLLLEAFGGGFTWGSALIRY